MFKEKGLTLKIEGAASTGDRGKCVSFTRLPVMSALSILTLCFSMFIGPCIIVIVEE